MSKQGNKFFFFFISSWSRESLDTGLDHAESRRELVHKAHFFFTAEVTNVNVVINHACEQETAEPEFGNTLRSPGIDSQSGRRVRQPVFDVPPARQAT